MVAAPQTRDRQPAERDGEVPSESADGRPGRGGDRREAQPGADFVKANYTKYEYMIPMRDGVRLHTAVYVPKDTSEKYPFLMVRTPYSCRPYGVDEYPSRLGPSGKFAEEKYIFVSQDVRGCWMSEGEFVDIRPHIADKRSPQRHRRSQRHVGHDRLAREKCAGQQRPRRPVGNFVSRLLHGRRHDRCPPCPQGLVAAGAAGGLVHGRRLASQRRDCSWRTVSISWWTSAGRGRGHIKRNRRPRFEAGTPDGYQFFLDMGPLREAEAKYMKGRRRDSGSSSWSTARTMSSGRPATCGRT